MRSQNPQSTVRSRERCRNNKNERCLKRTSLGDRVIDNLYLMHAVGMVDVMPPRAGSYYNLGTSRGPDPARGPCLARGCFTANLRS